MPVNLLTFIPQAVFQVVPIFLPEERKKAWKNLLLYTKKIRKHLNVICD